ncbi:ABC transporter permease [Nocardiopsis sp. MG754419]|uniref:ABC transporter permease n=1 Tax=Nocardiopsis sp. MG754419 TaxID=2259865 RepID=UPI001BA5CC16|nr:ABC transporter permease [Nocardiopsis sp. MG754419]MBR8741685.1 ABC transporter permease [Nocardiopsis sp. MG754419]
MTTATTTAPQGADHRRKGPGLFRQTLRLGRTEFTLFVRYKTASMYLLMPVILLLPVLNQQSVPILGEYTTTELSLIGTIGAIALFLGLGHPCNVFTARREALVLKRLRVSGVPATAIFGGVFLVVLLFTVLIAALIVAGSVALGGPLPADPVMLLLSVALGCLAMTMLGLLLTRFAGNAESAQILSMVPMMALLFLSGGFIPLDVMPDAVRQVALLLPVAPTVEMAQAAYFGYDVFGGLEGAEPVGFLGLWAGALPGIGVMLVWIVALALLVRRYFVWDPRRP